MHPTEPWVLSALYNGHLFLWNYNTQVRMAALPERRARVG